MAIERIHLQPEFAAENYAAQMVYDSPRVRIVQFCLQPGQCVPPHTAPAEVVFHVLQGRGAIQVGDDEVEAAAGDVVGCAPEVAHGLRATDQLVAIAVIAPRPG